MTNTILSKTDALLDAAAEVALNLRAHDSYRGSRRQALTALKRRRPGFSADQYEDALDRALALFDMARRLIDFRSFQERSEHLDPARAVDLVAAQCQGFPNSTYKWLTEWIDLYYNKM